MTFHNPGNHIFDGLPVLIGSLPLEDHATALEWILQATPDIPLWPQLPANPVERMLPQFVEGIPCIREENPGSPDGKIYFDTAYAGFDEEMLSFYEDYLAVSENPAALDGSRFATGRDRAAGLYLLAEKLKALPDIVAVKGQVTGPFTMLTGIKDSQGRAGYFNDSIRDMVTKGIAMRAAWQVRLLSKTGVGKPVLLFIDEPALAGLGSSAFISVTADEIREMINEAASAIHLAGGLTGIHVCANTDWELLLDSAIDILSFDAYGYFDRIAPLKNEVESFLDRGGIIAWGGIPTSREEDISRETSDTLAVLWNRQMASFTGPQRDRKKLLRQTLITPSCGTGSLSPELARRVLDLTAQVSRAIRSELLK